MSYQADRNAARLIIRRGEIKAVYDNEGQQLVDVLGLADELMPKIYRPQTFGESSNPPIGSDGIVMLIGGRPNQAVMLGSETPSMRPTQIPAGCKAIYNAHGDIISLLVNKIRIASPTVEVLADNLNITANVNITGDVIVDGDMSQTGAHTDVNGTHS